MASDADSGVAAETAAGASNKGNFCHLPLLCGMCRFSTAVLSIDPSLRGCPFLLFPCSFLRSWTDSCGRTRKGRWLHHHYIARSAAAFCADPLRPACGGLPGSTRILACLHKTGLCTVELELT